MLNVLSVRSKCVLATRATTEVFEAVQSALPAASYSEAARIITVGSPERTLEDLAKDDKYVNDPLAGPAGHPHH